MNCRNETMKYHCERKTFLSRGRFNIFFFVDRFQLFYFLTKKIQYKIDRLYKATVTVIYNH